MSTPSTHRSLAPNPNLESERRHAKKLLRAAQRGDADALQRIRAFHPEKSPAYVKLADAQFAIAREYGFLSWPRLVEYFEALERQQRGPVNREHSGLRHHESFVRSMLRRHAAGSEPTGRVFAAYVPRFYGLTIEHVLASQVTEEDARIVVARMAGFPGWDALVAASPAEKHDIWAELHTPRVTMRDVLRARDADALAKFLETHPKELQAREADGTDWVSYAALHMEMEEGPAARPVTDWVVSLGYDVQSTLNRMLIGHMRMPAERVQWLLERGADPNWVAPNGIPVLEYALVRYWNPEAVDVLAARAQPRNAFWIAAGVGDVRALDRYIDRNGQLTDAAWRHRPDFAAIWRPMLPATPVDDPVDVVWEAFYIAALNHRFNVLDVLLDRGFPIDYRRWGATMLDLAAGNQFVPVVEYLVRRGASPHAKSSMMSGASTLQAIEAVFRGRPTDDVVHRILALLGGEPDRILNELATRSSNGNRSAAQQ